MLEMKAFTENYIEVLDLVKQYGFTDPILFKAFSKREEKNLNFLLFDNPVSTVTSKPRPARKLELHDALSGLLKCNIVLTTRDQIEDYYYQKLSETNSVKLTENLLLEKLNIVFNTTSASSILESAGSFWPKAPSQIVPKNEDSQNNEIAAVVNSKFSGVKTEITEIIQTLGVSIDLNLLFDQLKFDVSEELKNRAQSSPLIPTGGNSHLSKSRHPTP